MSTVELNDEQLLGAVRRLATVFEQASHEARQLEAVLVARRRVAPVSVEGAAAAPATPAPPAKLWTVAETAEFLSKSTKWVYARAANGDLPSLLLGGSRRFDPEVIRKWAADQADTGASVVSLPSGKW